MGKDGAGPSTASDLAESGETDYVGLKTSPESPR